MISLRNKVATENCSHSYSHPVSTGWTWSYLQFSKPFQRFSFRRARRVIPRRPKPLKRLTEAVTPTPATRLKPCVNERIMLFVITISLLLVGCRTNTIVPVALAPEDMCSYCRMAISEKQYAAEVIDSDGQAFKFDDIGCMVNFVENKKNKAPVAAYFVMDFDRREWIKGEEAHYVRTSEVTTPMNSGIIAFRTQSQAQQAVDKYQGKLLSWKDIVR